MSTIFCISKHLWVCLSYICHLESELFHFPLQPKVQPLKTPASNIWLILLVCIVFLFLLANNTSVVLPKH